MTIYLKMPVYGDEGEKWASPEWLLFEVVVNTRMKFGIAHNGERIAEGAHTEKFRDECPTLIRAEVEQALKTYYHRCRPLVDALRDTENPQA
jgi:hypothetical protein